MNWKHLTAFLAISACIAADSECPANQGDDESSLMALRLHSPRSAAIPLEASTNPDKDEGRTVNLQLEAQQAALAKQEKWGCPRVTSVKCSSDAQCGVSTASCVQGTCMCKLDYCLDAAGKWCTTAPKADTTTPRPTFGSANSRPWDLQPTNSPAQNPVVQFGGACSIDTGGTCFWGSCSSSRGPVDCTKGKCLCKPGYCADASGTCVKSGATTPRPSSMPPSAPWMTPSSNTCSQFTNYKCNSDSQCGMVYSAATCVQGSCVCKPGNCLDFTQGRACTSPPKTETTTTTRSSANPAWWTPLSTACLQASKATCSSDSACEPVVGYWSSCVKGTCQCDDGYCLIAGQCVKPASTTAPPTTSLKPPTGPAPGGAVPGFQQPTYPGWNPSWGPVPSAGAVGWDPSWGPPPPPGAAAGWGQGWAAPPSVNWDPTWGSPMWNPAWGVAAAAGA